MKPHILLIDDSEAVHAAIASVLPPRDYTITTVSNGAEGLAFIEKQSCDLILLDYSLPDMDGLNLLQTIVKRRPDVPVIMVTGSGSERLAVKALKSGASDYVVKSTDFISKIPHVVRDNLDKFDMRRRNRDLEERLRDSYKKLKQLNRELEAKVQSRTEELERAYQLSNELMAKAVDSNMQLAELYSEVDESRRKLDGKIRELSLLNEVGKIIAATQDHDQLLQVTIDSAQQELGVEHCAILLWNEERQRFQIGISRGTPDDLLLAAKSLDGQQELLEVCAQTEPLLVQDIEGHARLCSLAQDFPGLECCILAPMQLKNASLGVFTAYGFDDRATFAQSELEFVAALTSQASIALANLRQTHQRIQEEQFGMIGKITSYLMRTVNASLTALREAGAALERAEVSDGERNAWTQILMHEPDRIVGLMQELLDFSYGQVSPLHLETLPVKVFLNELVSQLEPGFARQKMRIVRQLEYEDDFRVDVEKMRRVFSQLAENARESMSEGGQLTISSRLTGESVHFELRDEGEGLPQELLEHMFDPLVAEAQHHGIGLGMTMVKKILQEHHAQIEVQSSVAKGTTIHISLPRLQGHPGGHRI